MSYPRPVRSAFIISKFSLLATLRSPTSVVFSLLFPVIFIVVFGSIKTDQPPILKVAVAPGCDTANMIFKAIEAIPTISLQKTASLTEQTEQLQKGKLTAILNITANSNNVHTPRYTIHLQSASSSGQSIGLLQTTLNVAVAKIDERVFRHNLSIASVQLSQVRSRIYRTIDFILPGQLGFSLLMAGVYGSSFLLFSLRQNLVLKRLRTAPAGRGSIIAGEMLSRLFFHVITFIIIVLLGYYTFNFTLINGFLTLLEMLVFSFFGLFIFMATGFIISGVVQNENAIAPIANTVVLPQILLCGLFFPLDQYPLWLHRFCDVLPLTLFVDGLRKIAFDGSHIWQMPLTIGGLVLWTIVICPVAVRSFKWE
jgi:ABC-2 type transport system permease protein